RPDLQGDSRLPVRMQQFLTSRRNIVGSALAIVGLGAYLAGLIDHFWLAIVVGLYGVGYFATPKPSPLALGAPQGDSPEEIAAFLDALVARVKGKLEPGVLQRVTSIVSSINQTLPELARNTAQVDGTSFTVRQIATDYLPNALVTYLKLPPAYRTRQAVDNR